MAGEFLPPVVTRLVGDIEDLAAKIGEAKALIDSLDGKSIEINVSTKGIAGPVAGAIAQVDALKASLAGLNDKTVTVTVDGGAGTGVGALGGAGGGRGIWWLAGLTAGGAFTVLHVTLATLGAQIAADTIGIAAFGFAMNSLLGDAFAAASSVRNLTTQYAALDPYQQAAALSIKQFTDNLQTADEAGLLGVFYQGLNLVQTEMGKSSGIVTQATNAFGDFLGMLKADLGSKAWADLFSGTTGIIRTDLDALFKLINAGIQVIPGLFHNLNFLGTGFLDVATGTLHAVAAVTEWNPALTKAVALAGVAYGAYHILWSGIGTGPGILQRATTGISGFISKQAAMAAQTSAAATYMTEGETVAASYGVGLTAVEGSAVATGLAIAGMALAAGAVIFALSKADTSIGKQIASMRTLDAATGNNIAGYEAMDTALKQVRDTTTQLNTSPLFGTKVGAGSQAAANATAFGQYTAALQFNAAAMANVRQNADALGGMLGLTRAQTISAATATGIDLSGALDKTGSQFAIDANKIQGYATAVRLSHNPLSQFKVDAAQASNSANSLTDQVRALQAAYSALITPTLNVIATSVTFKNDQLAAATAIRASNGVLGLHTAAQRAAAQATVQTANDAITLSEQIKQQTGSTRAAVAPLQNFVSWLDSTGAKGAYVNQILRLIKQAEDALYNKTVTIAINTVNTNPTSGIPTLGGPGGHATGGAGGSHPNAIIASQGNALIGFAAGGQGGASQRVDVAGSGGVLTAAIPVHVFLDGRQIHQSVQQRTFEYNVDNANRGPDGRVSGTLVPRPT